MILIRFKQLYTIIILFIGYILSKVKKQSTPLWLFSERGTDARDNGYWLFRYVKENHPEINAKYVITRSSTDRCRLDSWKEDLIDYESFEHTISIWDATELISTHVGGYLPEYARKTKRIRMFFERINKANKIWLQHGIIKDNLKEYYYRNVLLDVFICGAKPEYDYITKVYGYPKGVVQYTGLARFDNLHTVSKINRQILVMPTWRIWLKDEIFEDSVFYIEYKRLLENEKLHSILKKYNLNLIFYPHYEIQPYIKYFKKLNLPANIIIADKEHYDVQQLLMESSLLITDYSSVFFDFAYMMKPIVFYQFDELKFRSSHYSEGYYNYHDGLGECTTTLNSLLESIQSIIEKKFSVPLKYKNKITSFFPLIDNNNCERIYNILSQLN